MKGKHRHRKNAVEVEIEAAPEETEAVEADKGSWSEFLGTGGRPVEFGPLLIGSLVLVFGMVFLKWDAPQLLLLMWLELPMLFFFYCLRWWANRVPAIRIVADGSQQPVSFWSEYARLRAIFFFCIFVNGLFVCAVVPLRTTLMATDFIIAIITIFVSHAAVFVAHIVMGRHRETVKGGGPERGLFLANGGALFVVALLWTFYAVFAWVSSTESDKWSPLAPVWCLLAFLIVRLWLGRVIEKVGTGKLQYAPMSALMTALKAFIDDALKTEEEEQEKKPQRRARKRKSDLAQAAPTSDMPNDPDDEVGEKNADDLSRAFIMIGYMAVLCVPVVAEYVIDPTHRQISALALVFICWLMFNSFSKAMARVAARIAGRKAMMPPASGADTDAAPPAAPQSEGRRHDG